VKSDKLSNFILVGIFGALIILLRSEFFALAPFLILFSFAFIKENKWQKNRAFKYIFSLIILIALVAPWTYRNYQVFDKFVPVVSHPWHEIWRGNNDQATGGATAKMGRSLWLCEEVSPHLIPKLDSLKLNSKFEINADNVFKKEAINYIKNNPNETFFLALKRVLFLWTIDLYSNEEHNPIFVLFVILTYIGLIYIVFKKIIEMKFKILNTPFILFFIIFAFYSLLLFLVNYETRYKVFVMAMSMPLTIIGFSDFFKNKIKE
jgi:4-amino-4-deoxy-L-arabinose transferase-like glycosyltransferase